MRRMPKSHVCDISCSEKSNERRANERESTQALHGRGVNISTHTILSGLAGGEDIREGELHFKSSKTPNAPRTPALNTFTGGDILLQHLQASLKDKRGEPLVLTACPLKPTIHTLTRSPKFFQRGLTDCRVANDVTSCLDSDLTLR